MLNLTDRSNVAERWITMIYLTTKTSTDFVSILSRQSIDSHSITILLKKNILSKTLFLRLIYKPIVISYIIKPNKKQSLTQYITNPQTTWTQEGSVRRSRENGAGAVWNTQVILAVYQTTVLIFICGHKWSWNLRCKTVVCGRVKALVLVYLPWYLTVRLIKESVNYVWGFYAVVFLSYRWC